MVVRAILFCMQFWRSMPRTINMEADLCNNNNFDVTVCFLLVRTAYANLFASHAGRVTIKGDDVEVALIFQEKE